MKFVIEKKEGETAVVSTRLSEVNKKYIEDLAKKHDVSESKVVAQIVEIFKKSESDSNKGKSKRTG